MNPSKMQQRRLDEEFIQWIELADRLSLDGEQVAAPFVSIPAKSEPSVLLVGKATGRDWYRRSFRDFRRKTMRERLNERRSCTKYFLEKEAPQYNSGFWHFARLLSIEAAKAHKQKPKLLENVIWTNICKVGVLNGNPSGECLRQQVSLACETLRSEIQLYRPSLICFVTWNYANRVVDEAVDDTTGDSWHKEEGLWWREAKARLPAIIWAKHPQGKPREQLEIWLRKAAELSA